MIILKIHDRHVVNKKAHEARKSHAKLREHTSKELILSFDVSILSYIEAHEARKSQAKLREHTSKELILSFDVSKLL